MNEFDGSCSYIPNLISPNCRVWSKLNPRFQYGTSHELSTKTKSKPESLKHGGNGGEKPEETEVFWGCVAESKTWTTPKNNFEVPA
jgi:hypothetical protein